MADTDDAIDRQPGSTQMLPDRAMMVTMNDRLRHVLLVGLSPEAHDSIAPALHEEAFSVHTVDGSPFVLDLIRGTSFELMVVAHPIEGVAIEEVVDAARCSGSMCANVSLLVITETQHLDQAARWIDHGVNRVVTLDWPRARIWQALADLLSNSPRVPLTATIRLELPPELARDAILLQTLNISETGAFLTGFRSLPLGTRFRFTFPLPGMDEAVRGSAEVVRRTQAGSEGIEGFGVRYLSLSNESRQNLAGFIEHHA